MKYASLNLVNGTLLKNVSCTSVYQMVHTFVCVQCIDIYMGAKYSDDVGT